MANSNYKVTIASSTRELTKRERVKYKELADAKSLDELSQEIENPIIKVKDLIQLEIHNEASENKDYTTCVIVDKDDNIYNTSSPSFIEKAFDIYNDLEGDDVDLKIIRKESKNFKGKQFITCTLV